MEGWQKVLFAVLLSVLVTVGGSWVAWGRDSRSESKVIDLIETHSPYIKDQRLFERSLVEIRDLKDAVIKLTVTMEGFAIVLQHQLDNDHHDEDGR